MSAGDTLTLEMRAEVLRLEDDLRARVTALPEVEKAWRDEYDAARAAERTAAAWEAWVDERVTLAAVAWVLTTVFVRFCEDNGLVKPVWISGPRSREALDAQQQFLRETARVNADITDREWLLEAVNHLKSLPATAGLVDETSPMSLVPPSGDAATRLLDFWRERDENGNLLRDLSDPDLDTRFLGDLYQDISEDAKKRYALLQTPVFVEEFILDRTLEPALNERPLEGFKMIDPTCGSGHFLLGGFQRLLDRWHKRAPGLDERDRVQAALDSVYGVDLNPFAVAIARFRLTVAALQACGMGSLEDAPAFKYHLAAGDSLLHGLDQGEFDLGGAFSADKVAAKFAYETEDLETLRGILKNGQYDAVVGNPPYIQVKDKALNKAYRERYTTCSGKYQLTVPFMERFFNLAKAGATAGWIGQITSNGFMKREFGTTLIEEFLPRKDLRLVIDSEGAWIPGHNMDGTPTVILVGRNASPSGSLVRAVLSKTRRENPGHINGSGPYWNAIVQHLDDPGYDSDWVTIADLDRAQLASHPWSLSGGGAVELMGALVQATGRQLAGLISESGFSDITGDDEVFLLPPDAVRRKHLDSIAQPFVEGGSVRDFTISSQAMALLPVDWDGSRIEPSAAVIQHMWPFRTGLRARIYFGKTAEERGLRWFDHAIFQPGKHANGLLLAFAFIATHNHFVLDRGGNLFNKSAPVIKLPAGASEDQHLELAGALNSSTACFWLKQVSQPKGGAADVPWSRTYEFTGTILKDFPLPTSLPRERARLLDSLATHLTTTTPAAVLARGIPTRTSLDSAREDYESARGQLIAQQEELDWELYRAFGLVDEDLTYPGDDLPELAVGDRSFEIVLARKVAAGDEATTWFERHHAKPIVDLRTGWPSEYRDRLQRRIKLVETHPFIRLLENPDHKRRWASELWDQQEEQALRTWLLDRLEERKVWFDPQGRPIAKSVAIVADEVARDAEVVDVLALWEGRPDVPVATSLGKLLGTEVVPFLAAYRFKDSGLRKRTAWETTWEFQRREDAGTYDPRPTSRGGYGAIPVPPKYATGDFWKVEYWAHRGKLDVPKERFILYPNAGRDGDATPVIGWAGWDHAQQALAVATLIQAGEQQGWSDERLIPLVAGLVELLPWVEEWHRDPEALYGGSSPAEFFSGLLESYMAKLGVTRETLSQWRPPAPTLGRKAKS